MYASVARQTHGTKSGWWLPLLIAAGFLYVSQQPSELNLGPVIFTGFIQLIPLLISLGTGSYSMITIASLDYFVTYSLAKINEVSLEGTVVSEAALYGSQVAGICCLIVYATYYATLFGVFRGEAFHRRYRELTLSKSTFLVFLAIITVFPFFKEELPSAINVPVLTLIRLLTLLVFTSLPEGMPEGSARRWVIFVNFGSSIIYFLITGSLGSLGTVVTVATIVGLMQRVRFYLIMVAIGMFGAMTTQTIKADYRVYIQSNPGAALGEKFNTLVSLFDYRIIQGKEAYDVNGRLQEDNVDFVENLREGFQRVGEHSLDLVLDQTPQAVPFWEGETYEGLAYIFIPRILWPEKPEQVFYNKFGRLYGVLSADDYHTSVAVNYMAEAYMNYGFQWMYLICIFVGAFLALVEHSLKSFVGGDYVLVFLVYAGIITHWAANLTILLNSAYTVTIMLFFMRPFIRKYGQYDAYS